MKVVKPIEVTPITAARGIEASPAYPLTCVNSVDIAPVWGSTTTYKESSTFNKVFVQYNGNIYESIKPNNLNNTPDIPNTIYWRYVTSLETHDFSKEYWSAATTYNTGDIVSYWSGGATTWPRYYQSLQNSNLNKIPTNNLTGTNPYWLDLGYSNQSKLYDIESNTQTVNTDELITSFTSRKAVSGGIFNAVGTRVLITAKSERNIYDNTSWIEGSSLSATTPILTDMCFSSDKNILLICGNSGLLKYSKNNGTSWTDCTTPGTGPNLKSIVYSREGGIFVAVGTSSDSAFAVIWKSLDGINWSNISGLPTSSVSLNSIIWIKALNKFVIAASNGFIYTSVDSTATTWNTSSVGVGTSDLTDLVYNPANGLIHLIGNQILRYSNDLINWTAISVTGFNIRAIGVSNYISDSTTGTSVTQYVYTATNNSTGANFLYISGNGTSWTQLSLGVANSNIPISVTYCYTEFKWVINCTGVVIAWSSEMPFGTSGAPSPSGYFYTVTPSGFDSTRTRTFYNGSTDTLFLFGSNSTLITSALIYFSEYALNESLVDNWYDYFYQDYALLTEAIFQNIPSYSRTRITVSVIGDIVKCGIVFSGASYNLGTTQYGASAGIIDYSKKETDEFGTTTFIKRAFSKRMNVNLILPSSDLYRVQKVFSDIRATPCVWIGSEAEIYRPLVMYGYYRDFSLEIPYPEYSYCSLQVEGLTE